MAVTRTHVFILEIIMFNTTRGLLLIGLIFGILSFASNGQAQHYYEVVPVNPTGLTPGFSVADLSDGDFVSGKLPFPDGRAYVWNPKMEEALLIDSPTGFSEVEWPRIKFGVGATLPTILSSLYQSPTQSYGVWQHGTWRMLPSSFRPYDFTASADVIIGSLIGGATGGTVLIGDTVFNLIDLVQATNPESGITAIAPAAINERGDLAGTLSRSPDGNDFEDFIAIHRTASVGWDFFFGRDIAFADNLFFETSVITNNGCTLMQEHLAPDIYDRPGIYCPEEDPYNVLTPETPANSRGLSLNDRKELLITAGEDSVAYHWDPLNATTRSVDELADMAPGSYSPIGMNNEGTILVTLPSGPFPRPAYLLKGRSKGDTNCDGRVDFGDINPFIKALSSSTAYLAALPRCSMYTADVNRDNSVDYADINPFVGLLAR